MTTRLRKLLPTGMTGLTGLACALCCTIPLLPAAGILGGAGWAAFGQILPGIALALAALAFWWSKRGRAHAVGCTGGNCTCSS